MEFRKQVLATKEESVYFSVFEHLHDIVKQTLCAKPEGQAYHLFKCLNRECEECGVTKFNLMEEEENVGPEAPTVNWQKF